MTIEVDTVTLPAAWACALVNGDETGLTEGEAAHMRTALRVKLEGGWRVVDVVRDDEGDGVEARFTWHYRLHGGDAEGGDVLDYVVHR